MSEPELDRKDPDGESMFDFLAEEGAMKRRLQKRLTDASGRPLPIIRKPVPVSESGPLLPPKPGAPVEPPPALTAASSDVDDELDFLNDLPGTPRDDLPWRSESGGADSDSNITRLDPRSPRNRGGRHGRAHVPSERLDRASLSRSDVFDDLDLRDAPEFDLGRKSVRPVTGYDHDDDGVSPRRGRWLLLALVLIAAGAGSFLLANPVDWRVLVQKFGMGNDTRTTVENSRGDLSVDDSAGIAPAVDGEVVPTVSPLMQRFRDKLIQIEGLVADGALDDAEQALSGMDRTLYGYGAAEFGDLETRIMQLRSASADTDPVAEQLERTEAARLAEEQAARNAAAQAAREEESRIAAAAEKAAQEANARRIATEQSAREELARVAAQQAAQEEQAQVVAQQEEQARIAAQQVSQEEQSRVAAENARLQAERLEQDRQNEQARQAARAARTSDWPSVNSDRQATDRRIAEERAAVQRQQAREQRLTEAREREAALAAQAASQKSGDGSNVEVPREAADNSQTVASSTQSIGDDDLQTVYRRFIDLQQAVSNRDINTVVSLTQRSGVRVQQLMQIFENSTQIDARIRNVSTSNATGQIKGTLQINRIQRANGTFVEPPAALSSIPLSSQREGDGWSAISW